MRISLRVSSLVCNCVFYRPEYVSKGNSHGISFLDVFRGGSESYQWIGLKVSMRKMGSFVWLSCLLPELYSLKCKNISY